MSYFLRDGWILCDSAHTDGIKAAKSVLFKAKKKKKKNNIKILQTQ